MLSNTIRYLQRSLPRNAVSILSKRPMFLAANPPTATLRSVRTRNLIKLGLPEISPNESAVAFYNLSYGEIADKEARNEEGVFLENGAFCVDTGKFTGRSPLDKYIVKQSPSEDKVWWGEINQPMEPEIYNELYRNVEKFYKHKVKHVYVLDGHCGAHPGSQKRIRFVTEQVWHHHFVKNMFIRPSETDIEDFKFKPDFTVINCYGLTDPKWKTHGLNSENFVAFNIEKKTALIGGAWYGGEMKKGIFSMMHYWLPQEKVLSMHCSANIGLKNRDTALFFGLSGTGKTTLSTDPNRALIGDDEHGWDDEGIFNFEGGCYAKTSKLSTKTEPEIYNAIKFRALLENVWIDPNTRQPDYFNESITENGRVSYPIEHIDLREPTLQGGHPKYIIFLCCDAFGTLPPVAKLTPGQAMYHFVSGYTAKVAGTERGIKEPLATFSPCYGAAFLTLHPLKYATLFKEKLEKYNVPCFLVNTGWSGGRYGEGERMSIKTTRFCLDSIYNGDINKCEYRKDPLFGFDVPVSLPNIDSNILDPKNTWKNKEEYDKQYKKLADMFAHNIEKYGDIKEYQGFGPTKVAK